MRERNKERKAMVDRQIAWRGVLAPRVLAAMRLVPRHRFVPRDYQALAYADQPLPIGWGQTISQPYIVAFMAEALGLAGTERVLEIGTGSGYQAAVLSLLASEVYSIERIRSLSDGASQILAALEVENVHLAVKDGYEGMPDAAPFDAIILSAAPPEVPVTLLDQLRPEQGLLVMPVGDLGGQSLIRITRKGDDYATEWLMDVAFVPMITGIAEE